MRRLGVTLGALALVAVALSGCVGGELETSASGTIASAGDHDDGGHDDGGRHGASAPTAPPPDGPIDVRIEVASGTREDELAIAPDPIEIPLGANVEIVVRNDGAAPHTFTVHGYGLDTGRMQPGEARTLAFRAREAGTFEVMCDEPGHYDAGMKATLVVGAHGDGHAHA